MPKYTINGKEVNENDFWTKNSTVVVSFSGANEKSPNTEGHSTRHKAAGLKSITDELNKSKNEKTDLQVLKESYLEYFKNDTWAKSKIVAAQTVQELSIAIEQITGRESLIIKQQEISKEDIEKAAGIHKFFEDSVKEILEEDLKQQGKGIAELSYQHLLPYYDDFKTEKLKRILLDEIHINKRNAINHILELRNSKGAPSQIIMDEACTGFNPFAGKKESEGKLFYEFDWEFIEACAKRMQNNKGKYPAFNWCKKIDVKELIQAQNRHHIEVMKGNYKDGDEELGHLTSYMCNAMLIWHQLKNFPQNKK